jgi:hypothetical protein
MAGKMQTLEPSEWVGDEDVARERARTMLDQIAQQASQALADAGIDLPVFFMIPNSGDSILTYGTVTDPPHELWEQVSQIVSSIVRGTVGLGRVRCREITCAKTHDHRYPQSPGQPVPIPVSAGGDGR